MTLPDSPQAELLLDGWPLYHCPLDPAGLHTWLVLLALQRHGLPAKVAWPAPPPRGWEGLPGEVVLPERRIVSRLWWEQWALPRAARTWGAGAIYGAGGLPLFGRVPTLAAPLPLPATPGQRLRLALAAGGRARATDLPPEALPAPPHRPSAPPWPVDWPPLPDAFVLYHVPSPLRHLPLALEVWTRWVAAGLGEATPLLLLGVSPSQVTVPEAWQGTLIPYPAVPTPYLPAFYARAVALFHPAPIVAPAGASLRLALAWGVPVVGLEDPATEALVGDAAYLAPVTDPRALGAALVTVVVETALAEQLAQRGQARAAQWSDEAFLQAVSRVLWTSAS